MNFSSIETGGPEDVGDIFDDISNSVSDAFSSSDPSLTALPNNDNPDNTNPVDTVANDGNVVATDTSSIFSSFIDAANQASANLPKTPTATYTPPKSGTAPAPKPTTTPTKPTSAAASLGSKLHLTKTTAITLFVGLAGAGLVGYGLFYKKSR